MKRILAIAAALVAGCIGASAQEIFFWTDDLDILPVRIYVDQQYIGDITEAYDGVPQPGDEGCLLVETTDETHTLTAINVNGRVYDGWPGTIRPNVDEVNVIKIKGKDWVKVNHSDYVYVDWGLWAPGPPPPPRHHMGGGDKPHHSASHPSGHSGKDDDDLDIDSMDDEMLLISMAVAAAGSVMAMTVAAVKNWNYPDNRFPYFSAGWNEEYLFGQDEWRSLARVKGRIGNLGGMSFIADAGWANRMNGECGFTYDLGLGLAYGGFEVDLRYKPLFGGINETFAVCDLSYDWWVSKHVGLNFRAGFGCSGQQELAESFEFPLGFGLQFKF